MIKQWETKQKWYDAESVYDCGKSNESRQQCLWLLQRKQAEKLKSREMMERWMKNDEGWMKKDEGWRMNDEGWWFQAVEGFWWRTDGLTNGHLWL